MAADFCMKEDSIDLSLDEAGLVCWLFTKMKLSLSGDPYTSSETPGTEKNLLIASRSN